MGATGCPEHEGEHSRVHVEEACGHESVQHGDHVDFEHDGHWHAKHEDHWDECGGAAA